MALIEKITNIADAIRSKTGTTDTMTLAQMPELINGIQTGGGGSSSAVSPKEVNFYDYDGKLRYAYTVAEAQKLSALPAGPQHPGLVFQGWNWSLEDVKGLTRAMNIGAMYSTDDGTTRLYITLTEGRTSPMLGVGVNGTVTVDWGDGTEPDVLTGTSTSTTKWTPNHAYAASGDYVIRLTVDGEIQLYGNNTLYNNSYLLHHATGTDNRNRAYQNALKRVEIGDHVLIGNYAFYYCTSVETVSIPNGVTTIGTGAFNCCASLVCIVIPDGVTSIANYLAATCKGMDVVSIPNGVTNVGNYAFSNCYDIKSITLPDNVTQLGNNAFTFCSNVREMFIPAMVTSIGSQAFSNCERLTSLKVPEHTTTISSSAFASCYALACVIMSKNVVAINSQVFNACVSLGICDFTSCITVPELKYTNAFGSTPADCEFRVPAALYDEWIAAANWATYASQIKAY